MNTTEQPEAYSLLTGVVGAREVALIGTALIVAGPVPGEGVRIRHLSISALEVHLSHLPIE